MKEYKYSHQIGRIRVAGERKNKMGPGFWSGSANDSEGCLPFLLIPLAAIIVALLLTLH